MKKTLKIKLLPLGPMKRRLLKKRKEEMARVRTSESRRLAPDKTNKEAEVMLNHDKRMGSASLAI